MSRGMRESRARMQRRILARMAELGIEPVLQGFWGMVPNKLREKYPDARIVDQGLWGRIFPTRRLSLPTDPTPSTGRGDRPTYSVLTDDVRDA